ncbi:MAG: HAMP domain-containing protein [Chloroflexi bacterium]|nr:MAG: HAMP domain-containing protein [Chloroflexota bacterium]
MKRLRGLSAQLLLFIVLPLFLALSGVALGSVVLHQGWMRTMVAERDLRAVRTAAAALSGAASAGDPQVARVLGELQMTSQTVAMLVDGQGRVLYRTDGGQVEEVSDHPGVVAALAGRSGTLYGAGTAEERRQVIAYAPVEPAGWALVVEEPWSEATNPWLRTSLLAPLVLVPLVGVALVALWLGVRRIMRPLQKLDVEVTALGWGDFEAVRAPVGGIQEIRELQRAIVRMADQIRAYQQSMHDYLGAVTAAQEEERKRLARELHDDTVQNLVAMMQRVQSARRKIGQDPGTVEGQLAELQDLLETTMDDLRRFSRALRPIYLEEAGLVAALEALARDTSQNGVVTTFNVRGDPWRLAPETELALYRIVQESLNNVTRHSGAARARVNVEFAGPQVVIRVEDDGSGFGVPERVSELAEAGHYGLMGMQERAQLVGARLTVQSRVGHGTAIQVTYPGGATRQPPAPAGP